MSCDMETQGIIQQSCSVTTLIWLQDSTAEIVITVFFRKEKVMPIAMEK